MIRLSQLPLANGLAARRQRAKQDLAKLENKLTIDGTNLRQRMRDAEDGLERLGVVLD